MDPSRRFVSIAARVVARQVLLGIVLGAIGLAILVFGILEAGHRVAAENISTQNKQAVSQIDMIFQQMNSAITGLESDKEVSSLMRLLTGYYWGGGQSGDRLRKELSVKLSEYQGWYDNIQSMPLIIYVNRDTWFGSLGTQEELASRLFASEGFAYYLESDDETYVSGLEPGSDLASGAGSYDFGGVALCRKCTLGSTQAVVIAMANSDRIDNLVSAAFSAGSYAVLDQYGYPVPLREITLEVPPEILEELSGTYRYSSAEELRQSGASWFLRRTTIGGWQLVRQLTTGELLQPYMGIILLSVTILAVIVAALTALGSVLIRRRLQPIALLYHNMQQLAAGDFHAPLVVRSGDEIEELSESYNEMRKLLAKHIKTIRQQEKTEGEIRYNLMISQLDPHFIYNTMHTITVLAARNKCQEVIEVNTALIQIMKDTLRAAKGDNLETVAHEVEMGKNYIVIQQYRYNDQFEVEWDVDPDVRNVHIPRTIIQPLVENAIFHGLMGGKSGNELATGGYICVTIRPEKKSGMLLISVSDDGVGMTPEQLEALGRSQESSDGQTHVTMANIRYRLQHIYQDKASVSVTSEVGEGTEVTIRLPMDREPHPSPDPADAGSGAAKEDRVS